MFGRLLGAVIVSVVMLAGVNGLQAQTAPAPSPGVGRTLDDCRDDATRRGIRGDGLSAFLTQCMAQPATATSPQRAGLDRCRADAIGRGLVGEARNSAIDDCMAQSGEMGSPQTIGTYAFCRSQSRAQGISGAALDGFMNDCIVRR